MRFVGSRSNTIGSKLIQWATGSKSSHVLIVFDDQLVIHSKLMTGVDLEWFTSWKKKNEIVWNIYLPLPLEKQEEIYQHILNEYDDKDYDYLAFLYWPIALIKHRFFKVPWPSHNPWGTQQGLLCTGLYAKLPVWLVGQFEEGRLEMTTPDKLGEIIKERVKKIEEELCR